MQFDYQDNEGYDVSKWQDDNATPIQIDFNYMKSTGAKFCGVKVGQLNYADPDFIYNWRECKKAGLLRFGYWFCDKYGSPLAQARKYWELLQVDFDPNEMQFADYEYGSWEDWGSLEIFMDEFQRLSGLSDEKFGIYTGYYHWLAHRPTNLEKRKKFGRHSLWEAWYTSDVSEVLYPTEFKEVLIWQDSVISEYVGQESIKIDHDKFNGGLSKLHYYMGAGNNAIQIFPANVYIGNQTYGKAN